MGHRSTSGEGRKLNKMKSINVSIVALDANYLLVNHKWV